MGWRGLGRIPGGQSLPLVRWVWSVTEPGVGFSGMGQVFQVQMGRWVKEMEPEPFAENSGPKTLDLN